jgi:hypothetical protein
MSGTAVALSTQAEQLQTVVAQFNLKKQATKKADRLQVAPRSTEMPTASTSRTTTRKSKSPRKVESAPVHRELELAGVGAGHDGFEEF